MNTSNISKYLSLSLIFIIFAFLINNYLTFAGDWPGAFSLTDTINTYSVIQSLLYVLAIILPILYIYTNQDLDNLMDL